MGRKYYHAVVGDRVTITGNAGDDPLWLSLRNSGRPLVILDWIEDEDGDKDFFFVNPRGTTWQWQVHKNNIVL